MRRTLLALLIGVLVGALVLLAAASFNDDAPRDQPPSIFNDDPEEIFRDGGAIKE
jgi:hypothetical protein